MRHLLQALRGVNTFAKKTPPQEKSFPSHSTPYLFVFAIVPYAFFGYKGEMATFGGATGFRLQLLVT